MTRTLFLLLALAACSNDPAPSDAPAPVAPTVAAPPAGAAPSATTPTPPLPEADRTVAPEVAAARTLLEAKNAAGAVAALDPWLAAHPDDADAHYWRGRARQETGDLPGAEQDLAFAMAAAPEWSNPRLNLADLMVAAKRCTDALPLLDRLVTDNPNTHALRVNRAFCLKQAGRMDDALLDLDAACIAGLPSGCRAAERLRKLAAARSNAAVPAAGSPAPTDAAPTGAEAP